VSRAPGSGSRARSRELGYADAMRDISHVLWNLEDGYKDLAREQMSPAWEAALTLTASNLREVRKYANSVSVMYELPSPGEFLLETYWHPRWGGDPAPAELPGRDQSENS
jgi:hypothetical protein